MIYVLFLLWASVIAAAVLFVWAIVELTRVDELTRSDEERERVRAALRDVRWPVTR